MQKLRSIQDPTAGRPIQATVVVREEAYHGRHLEKMPDIVYMAFGAGYWTLNPAVFISNKIIVDGMGPSGFHRMDGILLVRGEHIKKGARIDVANIMDVAPTILYLMGCEVPKDMDGRVLTELFTEGFLEEHPIAYGDPLSEGERQTVEVSPDDQLVILERLKGLGYVD